MGLELQDQHCIRGLTRDGRYVDVGQNLPRDFRKMGLLKNLRVITSTIREFDQLSPRRWKRRIHGIYIVCVCLALEVRMAYWTTKIVLLRKYLYSSYIYCCYQHCICGEPKQQFGMSALCVVHCALFICALCVVQVYGTCSSALPLLLRGRCVWWKKRV